MIKFYICVFIMAFSVSSLFSQQNTELTKAPKQELTKVEKPCLNCPDNKKQSDDFPVFIDTGNPDEDNARYSAEKELWIKNNPEKYNAMFHKKEETAQQREDRLKREALKNQNK